VDWNPAPDLVRRRDLNAPFLEGNKKLRVFLFAPGQISFPHIPVPLHRPMFDGMRDTGGLLSWSLPLGRPCPL